MSTIEARIADALTARAGGITMETSTIEDRLAQVRTAGVQDRRRRRGLAVGAAALAAAAAVATAFALGGELLGDESAAPRTAESVDTVPQPPAPQGVVVTGEVFPVPGTTYVAQAFAVPFRWQVPDKGAVEGRWRMGPPQAAAAGVGLDYSPSTGSAGVEVTSFDRVYRPDVPWTEQAELVAAPQDAEGWAQWFTATGFATVSERQAVQVAGLPAERMLVTVVDDLPEAYDGCAPFAGCLGLQPHGSTPGTGNQAGLFEGYVAEVTVVRAADRTLLITATGKGLTKDQWLPVMRQVVDTIELV